MSLTSWAGSPRLEVREAIEERDARGVRLTADQKGELLGVIRAWLNDLGISDLGEEFAQLRYELMRDLGVPPLDD
jgi:hypothetical protein